VRYGRSIIGVSLVGLLILASCGKDSKDENSKGSATTTPSKASATKLSGICPATVKIQTDWNPEAEHGFLYQMMGPNPEINASKKTVTGPLYAPDGDTGVKLEVLSGGPAIGFQSPTSQLYQDDSLLLGFVYTDEAIQNSAKNPTVAIVAPFQKNPQAIMWDPKTYPKVKNISDLGKMNVKIRYFSGAAYMDYLTSTGILKKSQVDGDYDGSPALFVGDQGKSASQIFGSAEPYIYLHEVDQWKKPVKYAYINDAGWRNYAEPLATKPANVTKYAACFKKLVPLVQQATLDYVRDPAKANQLILELVKKYNNGWVYSAGVAGYAVKTMLDDKLVADAPDGTLGSFDDQRVEDLIKKAIPVYTSGGKAPKKGLKPSDIVTNEFIDKQIKLEGA
jgi:hypothetical protein